MTLVPIFSNRFKGRVQPSGGGSGTSPWTTTGNVVNLVVSTRTVAIGASTMVGSEKLRVVESIRIDDDGATSAFFEMAEGSVAGVSSANEGRIRYNEVTQKWQISENTGGYVDITGGSGGATIDSTVYGCPAGVSVNDAVNVTGVDTVDVADASVPSDRPAIGLVVSKPSAVTCVVRYYGEMSSFAGLVAGSSYFLSDSAPGGITVTAPVAIGSVVQRMGVARNGTTLVVQVDSDFTLL